MRVPSKSPRNGYAFTTFMFRVYCVGAYIVRPGAHAAKELAMFFAEFSPSPAFGESSTIVASGCSVERQLPNSSSDVSMRYERSCARYDDCASWMCEESP